MWLYCKFAKSMSTGGIVDDIGFAKDDTMEIEQKFLISPMYTFLESSHAKLKF